MTDEGADFGLGLLCAERFRRPRAASDFLDGQKVTKEPLGGGSGWTLRVHIRRPLGPHLRGTRTCKSAENFRRAKSEWLSAVQSGPLGPGIPKIETNAVPVLRLALPSRWWLAWSRRARPPGRAAFGCCKKVVGAAHWAARLSSNRLETQGPPLPKSGRVF